MLRLTPLGPADLPTVAPWFTDPETRRRLGGFYPVAEQLALLQQDPAKHGWMAWEGERAVGLLELEIEANGIGYVLVLVAPAARGRGLGSRLVVALNERAAALPVRELQAWIATDAIASQRCFLRAGYLPADAAEDGFICHQLPLI